MTDSCGDPGNSFQERLVIFCRYPVSGQVKTRLIPELGADGAMAVHQRLTEHMAAVSMALRNQRQVGLEVCYDGGSTELMRGWLGDSFDYAVQQTGDLGQRMAATFSRVFAGGAQRVVLVGADCPDLCAEILGQAFVGLESSDLVLGPARDGGYYLIGMAREVPELFVGVDWGSGTVLRQTMNLAENLGISPNFLPLLADVDRPADLAIWPDLRCGLG